MNINLAISLLTVWTICTSIWIVYRFLTVFRLRNHLLGQKRWHYYFYDNRIFNLFDDPGRVTRNLDREGQEIYLKSRPIDQSFIVFTLVVFVTILFFMYQYLQR